MRWRLQMLCLSVVTMLCTGCVERMITITSEPPGALVWLNDREVGRTPVDVEFVYYGTYDVRLERDGYEPMMTFGKAKPPLWDNLGPDLVAELIPVTFTSDIRWHYDLVPIDNNRPALLDRAQQLREQIALEPPPTLTEPEPVEPPPTNSLQYKR